MESTLIPHSAATLFFMFLPLVSKVLQGYRRQGYLFNINPKKVDKIDVNLFCRFQADLWTF